MITESVVCRILHCSRCNTAFRDDANDDYDGVAHWETTDDITDQFKKGLGEYGGWRCFGNRFVCSNCQITTGFADDANAREIPEPLPPAEADKVARAQAGYAYANHHIIDLGEGGWTIQHPLQCRPGLFDCRVNEAAQRDLAGPPAELGRFVCGLDSEGLLIIHGPAVEVSV